jgi:hypothetical protein
MGRVDDCTFIIFYVNGIYFALWDGHFEGILVKPCFFS